MESLAKTPRHGEGADGSHEKSNGTKNGKLMSTLARPEIKSRLTILIALALIPLCYFASSVILPIVLALVGAMVLKPAVVWLARWHIPRALGALLILGIFFSAIILGFVELSGPAMKWMNDAPQKFSQLQQRAEKMFPTQKITQAINSFDKIAESKSADGKAPKVTEVEVKSSSSTGKALTLTGGLLASLLETVVLLYMLMVLGDEYLHKILDGTNRAHERDILKISQEIQQTISKYMMTVTMINAVLGIAVAGGLYFMGVPNAALWGLMAFLLNYIPYFGPAVGIIIVGLIGILTIDSFPLNILPLAWYLALHLAEADWITPVLLGRRFTLSPIVIFVFLMFWTWMWGPLGALLSVPILMSLKVVCSHVPAWEKGGKYL
jgi:predicted PurR-regulated permease PerM